MKKIIIILIAVLFINMNLSADNCSNNSFVKTATELYNSIYCDFENYYINEIKEEEEYEEEKDALYNDLVNAFEMSYLKETMIEEFQDAREDALFINLSLRFKCVYTCSTIGEELTDSYNDSLYNSILNSIGKKS